MEYDGYFGEKLIVKITSRVNHGYRFPFLHSITRHSQSMRNHALCRQQDYKPLFARLRLHFARNKLYNCIHATIQNLRERTETTDKNHQLTSGFIHLIISFRRQLHVTFDNLLNSFTSISGYNILSSCLAT